MFPDATTPSTYDAMKAGYEILFTTPLGFVAGLVVRHLWGRISIK